MLFRSINYENVSNFEWLKDRYDSECNGLHIDQKINELGNMIENHLGLMVPYLDEKQSKFFKSYYPTIKNKEFMLTEAEYMRK